MFYTSGTLCHKYTFGHYRVGQISLSIVDIHYYYNHLYSQILEYIKYPNKAIQCTKFLTI